MKLFASYSRIDGDLVSPVVALLRASDANVFRDVDTIQPGKKWQSEIATALSDSHVLLVFWCHHSSNSNMVKEEYTTAANLDKDIIPILLDSTPLPVSLERYQYIDFRALIGNHNVVAEHDAEHLALDNKIGDNTPKVRTNLDPDVPWRTVPLILLSIFLALLIKVIFELPNSAGIVLAPASLAITFVASHLLRKFGDRRAKYLTRDESSRSERMARHIRDELSRRYAPGEA